MLRKILSTLIVLSFFAPLHASADMYGSGYMVPYMNSCPFYGGEADGASSEEDTLDAYKTSFKKAKKRAEAARKTAESYRKQLEKIFGAEVTGMIEAQVSGNYDCHCYTNDAGQNVKVSKITTPANEEQEEYFALIEQLASPYVGNQPLFSTEYLEKELKTAAKSKRAADRMPAGASGKKGYCSEKVNCKGLVGTQGLACTTKLAACDSKCKGAKAQTSEECQSAVNELAAFMNSNKPPEPAPAVVAATESQTICTAQGQQNCRQPPVTTCRFSDNSCTAGCKNPNPRANEAFARNACPRGSKEIDPTKLCTVGNDLVDANANRLMLSRCTTYVKQYMEMQRKYAEAQNDYDSAKFELDNAKFEKESKDPDDEDLEANCVECNKRKNRRRGPSTTDLMVTAGFDVLNTVLGYRELKRSNERAAKLGWPGTDFLSTGLGYPYATMGLYGATYGSQNGSFACSGSMNGAYPYGPNPMITPYGPLANMNYGPYANSMINPYAATNPLAMLQNPMLSMYNPWAGPAGAMMNPWAMQNPALQGQMFNNPYGPMSPYGQMGAYSPFASMLNQNPFAQNPFGQNPFATNGVMCFMAPCPQQNGLNPMTNPFGASLNPYGVNNGMTSASLQYYQQMLDSYKQSIGNQYSSISFQMQYLNDLAALQQKYQAYGSGTASMVNNRFGNFGINVTSPGNGTNFPGTSTGTR